MTHAPAITRLGFLLIDDFALMSYAALIEPFRAANILSARPLYEWRHHSVNGRPARASTGIDVMVDGMLEAGDRADMLFVCAGGNPAGFAHPATFARLRRAAAHGTRIGGVSGGPYLLARAGLLDGYRCTVHWEHEAAFAEAFPHLALERGLYVVDGPRLTCAGGIAALDLALHLIGEAHGPALAAQVGEWYIGAHAREGGGAQRASLAVRYRVSHSGLLAALALMAETVAAPVARARLAQAAGVSLRQLERLFTGQVGRTVGQEYLRLRLETGMRLLRETALSRTEIAIACGFADAGHFSRTFRARYGMTPTRARQGGAPRHPPGQAYGPGPGPAAIAPVSRIAR